MRKYESDDFAPLAAANRPTLAAKIIIFIPFWQILSKIYFFRPEDTAKSRIFGARKDTGWARLAWPTAAPLSESSPLPRIA